MQVTQSEEVQIESVPSNQNRNESDLEETSKAIQTKKGI